MPDLVVLERRMPWDAKFRADVEKVMLNDHQIGSHVVRYGLCQQHANDTVQFIDVAQRGDAGSIFGCP
ncbi:Uncharacterised protein [Achromobacter xylosoxidans]|nr:hypothetical protein ABW35_00215 [Achromobacter xylosoxidans]KOQ31522.1 hypothetical protein ABW34_01160 [Achromobacter xylosoxidans]KOQ34857.1 hypothetical protein ABW36_04250 [Achromobacter xylosoxidans]KOQ47164.1 hypothetical protein ABW37_00330 [Achromobacter xylosoxidans]KOQ48668.1 hypothetical protein ABW38_13505 [Achromobacter xylosoxidans]